ncbi:MAG: ABC transporter permease subunit [Cyanobacteriota bacterium]|nr:ABC transporter permease subunit [Cyanobacteriota bacterium]
MKPEKIWIDWVCYGVGMLLIALLGQTVEASLLGWGILLAAGLAGRGCWGLARAYQGWIPPLLTLLLGLLLMQTLLVGYGIPPGLMPTPSRVVRALWTARAVLLKDSLQTFGREATAGWVAGIGGGILLGLGLTRFGWLGQGLIPYLAIFSSIPIPALAPVVVGALGVEWPSKAVIAALVVLFPVVINTVRGVESVNHDHLDLMRSYAADPRQDFQYLRWPQAQPYLFHAAKLAATLAVIAAIVGEFFGAPGYGLGFRIKIEAARFNFDIVWAAIVYVTVLSTVVYLVLVWLEKRFVFWHSSVRVDG